MFVNFEIFYCVMSPCSLVDSQEIMWCDSSQSVVNIGKVFSQ